MTTEDQGHRYYLSYRLDSHPDGLTRDEAKARVEEGFGACDAVLMASIIYPEDGSYSCLLLSKDGRTGEDLTDDEMFKVWTMMANRLMNSRTLGDGRRGLASFVFEQVRAAILQSRNTPEG